MSDLVPDEADSWCKASADAGIDTIFLVAPTSTKQRIDDVAAKTTGFVYAVSRTGVTGAENQVPVDVRRRHEELASMHAGRAAQFTGATNAADGQTAH